MDSNQFDSNWDDVICSICLDFPHNAVLLQCSSYDKGCRPFVCDTDHLHSNCLDRFKIAHNTTPPSTSDVVPPLNVEDNCKLCCPLCRGNVSGWEVIDEVRIYLDEKKRCCEQEQCRFMGTYLELQQHTKLEHPHARPSKIDPARQLDWENFQQSSEIIDVLSTIHSEVPRGVVFGDYVIEYGDDGSGDEFEDFPGDDGNWWTSCILYQVFDRNSRNRRRSRIGDTRRASHRLSNELSNSDNSSVASIEFADYGVEDIEEEIVSTTNVTSRGSSNRRSYRRRRSRFYDS